jgi:hypothetical protein
MAVFDSVSHWFWAKMGLIAVLSLAAIVLIAVLASN